MNMTAEPFVADPDFTLYLGDVQDVLASLPDESVHCVVTSPPYWGLRDYGTGSWAGGNPDCDHKAPGGGVKRGLGSGGLNADGTLADHHRYAQSEAVFRDVCGKCGATRQDRQVGLEPTPEAYVARMVDVFRQVRRVMRKDATLWANLGDSYGSGVRTQWRSPSAEGKHGYWSNPAINQRIPGTPAKQLLGMPWRLAFALQADGWYLRSEITWCKRNCMPESVTDRPTKATEKVFLLTRSPRYFYDQDAVREPHSPDGRRVTTIPVGENSHENHAGRDGHERWPGAGRNLRDWWEIATEAFPAAHFATFPQALVEPCIKAGTSERGCCPVCDAPWEREIEATGEVNSRVREDVGDWIKHKGGNADGKRSLSGATCKPQRAATGEWSPTCGHERDPVPCVVLDPFMGSGTTALVARRLGRRSIGVELNPEYAQLCAERLSQLSLLAGELA